MPGLFKQLRKKKIRLNIPVSFTLPANVIVNTGAVATSSAFIVSGSGLLSLSVTQGSSGAFSINGGAWTSTPTIVNHGNSVRIRVTVSLDFNVNSYVDVTIGSVTNQWIATSNNVGFLNWISPTTKSHYLGNSLIADIGGDGCRAMATGKQIPYADEAWYYYEADHSYDNGAGQIILASPAGNILYNGGSNRGLAVRYKQSTNQWLAMPVNNNTPGSGITAFSAVTYGNVYPGLSNGGMQSGKSITLLLRASQHIFTPDTSSASSLVPAAYRSQRKTLA